VASFLAVLTIPAAGVLARVMPFTMRAADAVVTDKAVRTGLSPGPVSRPPPDTEDRTASVACRGASGGAPLAENE
jgi:hypothetical protein